LYSFYLIQIAVFRQYNLLVYFLHAYFQVNQHVDKLETFDLLTVLTQLLWRFLELHGHLANVSALVEVRVQRNEVVSEAVNVPVQHFHRPGILHSPPSGLHLVKPAANWSSQCLLLIWLRAGISCSTSAYD